MERVDKLDDVSVQHQGYLLTPMLPKLLEEFTPWDDVIDSHEWGWPEYVMYDSDVYPTFLEDLAKKGIAFGWEYECTEDFTYFAYNFPLEGRPFNLFKGKTGRRKHLPRLTKKLRKQLETETHINELLYNIGIKNGSN